MPRFFPKVCKRKPLSVGDQAASFGSDKVARRPVMPGNQAESQLSRPAESVAEHNLL